MKKIRKPTKAQREAQASFDALCVKWATVPKFARAPASNKDLARNKAAASVPKTVTYPPGREPQPINRPSESSFKDKWVGGTKPVHGLRYTGDRLLGIATMHKSNAVPVFNNDQAVELAKMRRG